MPWPNGQDYQEALQNPQLVFVDPELRDGAAESDKIGLPRVNSGAFACVFKIQSAGKWWAAKCFTSEVSDQHQRYEAISKHLAAAGLEEIVPFTYLGRGIKIQGREYPLLKMQWVQGESLSSFVGRSIGYPDTLFSLAKVWTYMMADLKAAKIAHGDLQHGNIVVVGDQLRLIDYDGMFVPALAGKQSNELGHRNYQLPTRTQWDYGTYLDNFSAWVIYVSLVALAVHPELWAAHRGGDECLIFRKEDFIKPEDSPLLRDLNASPNSQLRILVGLFTSLVNLTPQDVPALDGNLTVTGPSQGSITTTGQSWWSDHVESGQPMAQKPAEAIQEKEPDRGASDPGWIVDSLMESKTVAPLPFKNKPEDVRLIILGSMALVFLTRLLVEIPMIEFSVIVTFVLGLNLLVCFVRYKSDPSFEEFAEFNKQSKEFVRKVQEQQNVVNAIGAERIQIQQKLNAVEQNVAEQISRLGAALQTNLADAQMLLDSQLQGLNQRRRDNSTAEASKLNALQSSIGNQISELDRKLNGLNQQEADEKWRALKEIQDAHIDNYLRRYSVEDSSIPGVTGTFKSRVIAYGYRTAADIEYYKVRSVPGIGQTRGNALIIWRTGIEHEARQCAPSKLSDARKMGIEAKYRSGRQTFIGIKQQSQLQLDSQVASARQFFADQRQSMSQEEQQLRSSCFQNKAQFRQTQDEERASLEQKVHDAKMQAGPTINELSQKMQGTQKQVFALRWKSAEHERNGRRFASLRFRDYLKSIYTP